MTVLLSHRGKERNPVNRLLNRSGSLACILGESRLRWGKPKRESEGSLRPWPW